MHVLSSGRRLRRAAGIALPLLLLCMQGWPALGIHDPAPAEQTITAGSSHACVLLTGKDVHCWGSNHSGKAEPYTQGSATQADAGGFHTCARLQNGNVHCWGSAASYTGGDAERVSAGGRHTCALLENGDVRCWGANSFGQSDPEASCVGQSTCTSSGATPYHLAEQVSTGWVHTCALRNGNVDCWGQNPGSHYTGGDGVQVSTSSSGNHSCVLLASGDVHCWGNNVHGQSAPYDGADAIQVAAGGTHTCVLRANGNVHCWGSNPEGESTPYTGGDAVQVAAGLAYTCALLTDHTVRCWGHDLHGQSTGYAHTCRPATTLRPGEPMYTKDVVHVSSQTPISLEAEHVTRSEYRIGGQGEWAVYTRPFHLDGPDGPRAVEYHGADEQAACGCWEEVKQTEYFVDNTPPRFRITDSMPPPTTGLAAAYWGTLTIATDAQDPIVAGGASGVDRVEFYVDDVLRHTATAAPWEWEWDTSGETSGLRTLRVIAMDRLGNGAHDEVQVLVIGQTSP